MVFRNWVHSHARCLHLSWTLTFSPPISQELSLLLIWRIDYPWLTQLPTSHKLSILLHNLQYELVWFYHTVPTSPPSFRDSSLFYSLIVLSTTTSLPFPLYQLVWFWKGLHFLPHSKAEDASAEPEFLYSLYRFFLFAIGPSFLPLIGEAILDTWT